MKKTSMFLKALSKGLFGAFLLVAIFAVLFGGVSRVEAAIGTACGDATGKGAGVSVLALVLTDSTKNWKPNPDRWKDGTLTITGSSVLADIGKKGTVASSTATTITIATATAWAPAGTPTGTGLSYLVTAKPNACRVGIEPNTKTYSCLQVGDAGYCKGPCSAAAAPAECNTFVGTGTLTVGWAGAKCTGTPAVVGPPAVAAVDGVCVELLGAGKELPSDTNTVATGAELLSVVDTATNWVFAIFVILSIIFILLAAFQFVTAGGEAEKVAEARSKLIWAVVGIIIALLAKGLVPVIKAIVGG